MIPDQSLNIIPKNQYYQLEKLLNNIYESWIIDQDKIRKNHFIFFFNIIKSNIEELFKNNNFWIIYSMNSNYCMHKNKKGKICNKRIDIKCNEKDKNSKWKCYHHISKTIYSSKKRDSVDLNKKCIGFTKYGVQKRPCKNLKWNNMDYCKVHLNLFNPDMNAAYFNYFLNDFLWKDIIEEHNIYLNNINLEKEIKLFYNINYDLNFKNNNTYKDFIKDNSKNVSIKRKIISDKIYYDNNNFKIKLNNNYYLENRYKKRKKDHKKMQNIFLNYKFSFNYTIKDNYFNNIKYLNKKVLNEILEHIINIRNCIYFYPYYLHNKTFMKILYISDKILEIIDNYFLFLDLTF